MMTMWVSTIVFPFYRWGKWVTKRLSNMLYTWQSQDSNPGILTGAGSARPHPACVSVGHAMWVHVHRASEGDGSCCVSHVYRAPEGTAGAPETNCLHCRVCPMPGGTLISLLSSKSIFLVHPPCGLGRWMVVSPEPLTPETLSICFSLDC